MPTSKLEVALAGADFAMTLLNKDLTLKRRKRLRRVIKNAILNALYVYQELRRTESSPTNHSHQVVVIPCLERSQ